MRLPNYKAFLLSLFFVVTFLVYIILWDSQTIVTRWTAFPGKNGSRWKNYFFQGSGSFQATEKTSVLQPLPETPMPMLNRSSFKKLPRWDFDDIYNQDAPPRQSTCAQSLRNSKDEKFRKAFLPNIRLYLHKDNINMSEWNRLSHFNNPFGFMQFKYDDVMAAVKLIPKPNEPLLSPKPGGDGCIHCAVVATGGILNGSKMGAEIDAHDYVFRMNGAAVEGFEEDVGNRTSVYVHTEHSIASSRIIFRKYGYTNAPHDEGIKYVMIPEAMRDYKWLIGLLKGEAVPPGQKRKVRFLNSSHLNRRYWAIVRPTNGAFTLFLALHTCDTVDAYGFITDDYKKYPNYYVHRHIHTRVIFFSNHDYNLEKNLWKDLHNRKIIKLYQRN
ncbi:alpha-N-acetylgalactosaminide alpha-2,6-sialyltransferase 1-like isoform 2-T2 [Pholidichthys leucotaenia]